jgi:hypothetical protein
MWLGIFVGIIAFVTLMSRVLGANLPAPAEGRDEVHFH